MARVMDDGEESPDFQVTNGVKQGCVLAPTLFSMMFSAMLSDAFQVDDPGVHIKYRRDGKLFNLRRLKAITKVKNTIIRDLFFADDCALHAITESEIQQSLKQFSSACDNFGLTISIKKIEVLHQPAPEKPYVEPTLLVKDTKLNVVDRFTYLGSTLSRAVHINDEINCRIAKASAAFGRLRTNVWERRGIKLDTKISVYRAVVLTTLLYACETWTVYARHARKLNHFHMTCLRRLLHIRWQDRIPDTEVLARSKLTSIHVILQKTQLRWTGHVHRMSDNRIPKQLLYGELQDGSRSTGGQKKRFKDTLKVSLKAFHIPTDKCEELADNRSEWRCHITNGAKLSEHSRTKEMERKRAFRKAKAASTSTTEPDCTDHRCPTCGRYFRARIGLTSHLRTHRNNSTT
ncbi:uncharacterized protein LOC128231126 [Mya arenaria]|uniref:uncharacterized protein LOC128231126 n=1 Tax=Mya arenaria TaxID=6604 RepID=UPI0022E8E0F7|nr:uncharacterized protein LOC128231126 [Mya arenaria]